MSHPNQGLEGIVRLQRAEIEELQATLEQAQEKLTILQGEKAEIEAENVRLRKNHIDTLKDIEDATEYLR